jgi:hypothetical protein
MPTLLKSREVPATPATSPTVGRLSTPQRWCIAVALGALLLIGAGLRFDQLDSRGMGHVESYTPGLPLPEYISTPSPRLTLWDSIRGPIFEEPHPPAWYALMYPWTRIFGTALVTIRLPSVLLGVAAIGLIYRLGVMVHGWQAGLMAAGLLTFNGHHLLFSQVSRPTVLAVVLSIGSTLLLLMIARGGKPPRLLVGAYLLVTLVGLATLYYFWPILAAQMIWIALRSARQSPSMQPLLRLQWLLVILGSPLVTLAIFQQFNSFLDSDALSIMVQYLEFGFLFEPDNFGVLSTQAYIPDAVRFMLPIACVALIVLGLVRTRWRDADDQAALQMPTVSLRWLTLAALLAFALIVCETIYFQDNRPGRVRLMLATGLIPLAVVGGFWLIARVPPVTRLVRSLQARVRVPGNSMLLMYVLTVVPPAIITGVSLLLFPFFASRHMLLYTPYLLIVTSVGIVELYRLSRRRLARVAVGVAVCGLLLVHLASISYSRDRLVTLVDYQGLAAEWLPRIQAGDMILVQPHWATTPIFYYVDCNPSRQYSCVGYGYQEKVQAQRPPRVWVLAIGETPPLLEPDLGQTLDSYQDVSDVEARSIRAELYTPR